MAGPWTKSSALETYFSTVTPVNPDGDPAPQPEAVKPRKPVDKDWQEGARAVILTILNNAPVLSDGDLRKRSEFAPDLYDSVIGDLTQSGLVERMNEGYCLTEDGRRAAWRERDRLLGMT